MSIVARQVAETFDRAEALRRAEDERGARVLLEGLLRAGPECMNACIDHVGTDASKALWLARVLLADGRAADAERVLHGVYSRAAANPEVVCVLARARLALGHAHEALDALLGVSVPPRALAADYWMLRGHACMALARPADAARAFREWLKLEPRSVDARLRLAAALADDQRGAESEVEVRRCMRAGDTSPNARFVLGRALMDQRRFEEAEACFREVVRARPDYVTAQDNLSELVWMRTGDVAAASAELDSALCARPAGGTPLRVAKARLWLAAGHPERALAVLEEGLAAAPGDVALLRAAAGMALQCDAERAFAYAQRVVRTQPDDWSALAVFGNALLARGKPLQALAVADRLCKRDRRNGEAIAMRADALRMAGDVRCRELLDYAHFVRAELLAVPAGWPDLDAYVGDLARALDACHGTRAHPVTNSLRGGSQVLLVPERSDNAAVHAFPAAIDGVVRRYLQALGTGPDPMRSRNTGGYRLNGTWSVRLRPNGFHLNHYHPNGWVSSSCYLRLPPSMVAGDGAGWLQFGEPAFPTCPRLGAEYCLRPEPGLLALFPSYLWHGTRPFSGSAQDTRLTIAFDVVPAGEEAG